MEIKSTKKQLFREYLIPLLLEYLIMGVLIFCHRTIRNFGVLLAEPKLVGDEMSSPTMGRFVYAVVSFLLFAVFTKLGSNAAKKDKDLCSFWFGFTAGVLLWQSVGESFWHFAVGGINFVVLENITSFPLAVLFVMLMIYGKRHHSFDWGVWCMLLSFACNWIGHYITIGIYPFVEPYIASRPWNVWVSVIFGGLLTIYSFQFLLFRAKTTKGRMLASMMTYIALAIIFFGIAEG